MEKESEAQPQSTPPEPATEEPAKAEEEPATAVPTRETTPVWVRTVPTTPPAQPNETFDTADEAQALPAKAMSKGDPDWSHTQTPTIDESKPATAVPMQKAAPGWAQTVPSAGGDSDGSKPPKPPAKPSAAGPLRSSAATQRTWPPSEQASTAPPEETDIWPPEPPTESMPAWPPSSEVREQAETAPTPERPMPTWEAFGTPPEPSHEPAPPDVSAPPVPATAPPIAQAANPEPEPSTIPPPEEAEPVTASKTPEPSTAPPVPEAEAPTRALTPAPVNRSEPVAPAQPATPTQPPQVPASPQPSRPPWAPAPTGEGAKPAQPKVDWPAPVQIPSWAPHVSAGPETSVHQGERQWFTPEPVRPTHNAIPPVAPAPPTPTPPAPLAPTPAATPPGSGQLPVAQIRPAQPAAAPAPTPAQPEKPQAAWEVVEQHGKTDKNPRIQAAITAEDRSYAEWFAWAKRGGAPASACHAAAQGAFAALSTGKDLATAVQWATAAMSRPPAGVSASRQTYCAWFSLGHIDLNIDQARAHAFATAAVQALDSGSDAAAAHAAGLLAAGIR